MQDNSHILAKKLRARRWEIRDALIASIADWDKYPIGARAEAQARKEFVRMEMLSFIDYLAIYFQGGDRSYLDLYSGEKLKQCYETGNSAENFLRRRKTVTASDCAIIVGEMSKVLSLEQLELLTTTLDSIRNTIIDPGRISAKVLFVGDCLHLDVVSFLTAPLLSFGITLESTYAASKNSVEMQRFLRSLDGQAFDLIFFSPFSYAFHISYSELLFLRTAAASKARLRGIVESAQADTLGTLRLLGDLFEAPILVHNSANVRRHDGSLQERARNVATLRARKFARKAINQWLPDQIAQLNALSFPHYFLLDEAALLNRFSQHQLGKLFYSSELQHPAKFGRAVAGLYQDVIVTQKLLAKKKVIVWSIGDDHLSAGLLTQ